MDIVTTFVYSVPDYRDFTLGNRDEDELGKSLRVFCGKPLTKAADEIFNDSVCLCWFLDELMVYRDDMRGFNGSTFTYAPPPELSYFTNTLCRKRVQRRRDFDSRQGAGGCCRYRSLSLHPDRDLVSERHLLCQRNMRNGHRA